MRKAKNFQFYSYNFLAKQRRCVFRYKVNFTAGKPLLFTETIILPKKAAIQQIPTGLLDNLLQNIHLILGISYYKLYCPTEIKLNKPLSKEQAIFWRKVYQKGLGEFFYRNKLNPKKRGVFPYKSGVSNIVKSYSLSNKNRSLLGIGGGKDSIVARELLREGGYNVSGFVVETQKPSPLIKSVTEKMNLPCLKIRRVLDEKIFTELPSSYKGHIPISAIYGFLGLLTAALYDYSNIIVANEYSSNFGNIAKKGETINHQWSKSSEFEMLFQNYVNDFISPGLRYFSILRPFYEIRIVKMFAKKYKKYFSCFSSCNQNFAVNKRQKNTLWCGQCPKCAFLFLLLSAFVSKKELLAIFQKNLFEDEVLRPLFGAVLGFQQIKPFDCVGTFEEARVALYLSRNKFKNTVIVKKFLAKIENPQALIKKVFAAHQALNIPTIFRFCGMDNFLIMGYGKEGKATEQYLKKYFPNKKIAIADQKQDKNYLAKQKNYDLAVKTPSLQKKKVQIQYITATNLFFAQISKGNKIIGVTGSKGKSTTATLIYEILKASGKKVRLLGNIGFPMLESLGRPIQKEEVFVLEISSYQLDDIEFSPNISIVTNLFPEHMDWHEGIKPYFEVKKNIIKFQKQKDIFVYNPKVKELKKWAKQSKGQAIPFISKIPFSEKIIPLLGEHNKSNIKGAIAVAKLFDIPDEIIKKALKSFKPLPHRLERVGEYQKIIFYDDAISTTPDSTIMAIKSIPNIGTIFLGGEDRGYDFSQLEKIIKKYQIRNIVLFPETGRRIFKKSHSLNILRTDNMEEAVRFAYKNTPENSVCLLSTASPSYTLWENFEKKGELFQKYVKKYAQKN